MKKFVSYTIISLLWSVTSKSQTITTFAGGGSDTNDSILATTAYIYSPNSGVFDKWGNYYIASPLDHSVKRIDTLGILTTIAGSGYGGFNGDGGLADTSAINTPGCAVADTLGNIYIADGQNNRIRKVNILTNVISTIAGNGTAGFSGDGGLAVNAQLNAPSYISFDKFGNLYISDAQNSRIRKVNTSGVISTVIGTGVYGYSGDGGISLNAEIGNVRCVIADSIGNLYFTDVDFNCVRKVDLGTGIISTVAGTGWAGYVFNGDNINATSANVRATMLAFDKFGDLYISDHHNNRIRKVNMSTGIITTVAGDGTMAYGGDGGPATSAQLNKPCGVAFDKCDNLYIAQVNDGRVRKVIYNDSCEQLAVQTKSIPNEISIYPNPAKDRLTITSQTQLKGAFITNAIGQSVLHQTIGRNEAELSIAHLQAGVYFLTVTDANGAKLTRKIIKE